MKIKLSAFVIAAALAAACNVTTANLASLKTGKEKGANQESTTFKAGETLYASAAVANNPGGVKVVYSLKNEKGDKIPGTETSIPMEKSGTAEYSVSLPAGVPSGKYTVTADLVTDSGEKKGSKSVTVTIEGAPAAAPAADGKDDKGGDHGDKGKDDKEAYKDKDDK